MASRASWWNVANVIGRSLVPIQNSSPPQPLTKLLRLFERQLTDHTTNT